MPTTTAAAELRFRAMGSDVHVLVVGGPRHLLGVARERVEELERRWSRFRPDSEISRLNTLAGSAVHLSPATLGLVQRALEGARISGGRYDLTVLGDVLRAGYDQTFERLADHTAAGGSPLGQGYAEIVVDPAGSAVTMPAGVGIDPGGIGKGYAADLLVEELRAAGAAGVCVNLGGDLRVDGSAPGGGSWVVGIGHPLRPTPAATVALQRGAIATSSRVRRAWGPQQDRRHHLIDPATGRPAASGLAAVTVLAARGWQAEVLAKAAFLGGLRRGPSLLAARGADGLLVDDQGGLHPTAGFRRFTPDAGPPAHLIQDVAG
jgi:thiamine biosynthesis lipoprotein